MEADHEESKRLPEDHDQPSDLDNEQINRMDLINQNRPQFPDANVES